MRVSTIALVLTLFSGMAIAAGPPQRVVSVNLCSDQLLLLLAAPEQVASVSYLSRNPNSSFVADEAKPYPLNHARAEEIVALKPDLVLLSPHSNSRLRTTLEHLGYPLLQLSLGHQLDEIYADIRLLATRLGRESQGESLISRMQRQLQSDAKDDTTTPPTAVFYQPRGYTSGSETLQDEAMRLAGWNNLATQHGIKGYTSVPLEDILRWQPETLFTSNFTDEGDSLAERQLRHPALKRLLGNRPMMEIPYKYWICPGPMLADAVTLLREARTRMGQ